MIRFLTGWSNPGGSTVAFINLVNALNKYGHESILGGPHTWHLDKCKSEQVVRGNKLLVHKDDIIVAHYMRIFVARPPVKGFFLSSQEQEFFPLNTIDYGIFDKIHYVSEHHKDFHGIAGHPHFIIPNILEDLKPNSKPTKKIGGIIGTIDKSKRVSTCIKEALEDGCDKVLIYGMVSDPWYWQDKITKMIDGRKVQYMGFEDDKQKMYDSVTDVYAGFDVRGNVEGECNLTETNFHGQSFRKEELDKKSIVKRWVKELGV